MDVNEFKIRLMRGIIRPEYFYIPVKKRSAEKIIRYVISVIDNPFAYPDFYQCEEYDEYVYCDPSDSYYPFPGYRSTVQGRIYIESNNDEVLRKGWCNNKHIYEEKYSKIICVKIYNGDDYLGYFCTTESKIDSRNYRYYKYDCSHNQQTLVDENVISGRWDDVSSWGVSYYDKEFYAAPERRREFVTNRKIALYLEPFNIQGDDGRIFELNQNFEVVDDYTTDAVSDRTVKYRTYPYEWKRERETIISNPRRIRSGSYCRFSVDGILNYKYVITSGKNGIDLDKQRQRYYMQEDVQVDFPNITTNCNPYSVSLGILMYYNNQPIVNQYHNYETVHVTWQDNVQTGVTVNWTDDEDPAFSSNEPFLNCYYLGDGLTKETCALYQTIFYNNDYESVGASGISYEIEGA